MARAHYHTTCHFGPQQPLTLFPPRSGSAEASDAAGNARPSGGRPMGWRCVQQPAARLVSRSAAAVVAPLVGTPFLSLIHSLSLCLSCWCPPLKARIIAWSRWPTQASSHQSGKVGQGGLGLSRFGCRRICARVNNDITSSNSGCVAYQMRLPPLPHGCRSKEIPPPHPSSVPSISHTVEPMPRVPTLRVCHHPALICCHVLPLVATSSRPLNHLL